MSGRELSDKIMFLYKQTVNILCIYWRLFVVSNTHEKKKEQNIKYVFHIWLHFWPEKFSSKYLGVTLDRRSETRLEFHVPKVPVIFVQIWQ